jgi:hypothetical protein
MTGGPKRHVGSTRQGAPLARGDVPSPPSRAEVERKISALIDGTAFPG